MATISWPTHLTGNVVLEIPSPLAVCILIFEVNTLIESIHFDFRVFFPFLRKICILLLKIYSITCWVWGIIYIYIWRHHEVKYKHIVFCYFSLLCFFSSFWDCFYLKIACSVFHSFVNLTTSFSRFSLFLVCCSQNYTLTCLVSADRCIPADTVSVLSFSCIFSRDCFY